MPAAERRAALVISHCLRNVGAGQPGGCATDSKINVLQIRLEIFVQQADAFEQLRPENSGCKWGELNLSGLVPYRRIQAAISAPPGACPTADRIETAVDSIAPAGVE